MEEFNYLDLFSGVGGFHHGFINAGVNIAKSFYSEIDKHAIAVYKYHFKNSEYVGSVTDVSGTELRKNNPGRWIVTFGFPCQDLSIAGKGAGLTGKRSGLFFEAIRIIKELQPEVFIFENVKGLLSSNEGKDFEVVLRTIADIGLYECEWQLVNTAWLLPQNRERIYFIGHLRGRSRPKVFPFRESDFRHSEKIRKGQFIRGRNKNTSGCLDTRGTNAYDRADLDNLIYDYGQLEHRTTRIIQKTRGDCTTFKTDITGSLQAGGNNVSDKVPNVVYPMRWQRTEKGKEIRKKNQSKGKDYTPFSNGARELVKSDDKNIGCITNALNKDSLIQINSATKQGYEIAEPGDSINLEQPNSKTRRGRVGKQKAQTLNTNNHQAVYQNTIRRLTPTECERLQGFPDSHTEYGNYDGEIKNVSDTQRYKMMGNAITTTWAKLIGGRLINGFL